MHLPPEAVRAARRRFSVGVVFYVIAFGISFVVPWIALVLQGAMAGYYLFDQASVPSGEPA